MLRATRLAVALPLGLALVVVVARAEAHPKPSTLIRRGWHALLDKLPAGLRREHPEVNKLFASSLRRDPSSRTGLAEAPAEPLLERKLRERVPKELFQKVKAHRGSPLAFVERYAPEQVPTEVREQIDHSIHELARLVRRTTAAGRPDLARLIAAEQTYSTLKAMQPEKYENEVPDPEAFRHHNLAVVAPPRGSERAVVLRSLQPARVNLREIVKAAGGVGIRPEEIAILDLRMESDRDARWIGGDRDLADRVRVVQMPLVDHTLPTYAQLKDTLRLLTDPRYKLVHIHCRGGRGRTGVVLAAMRIALDGWSVEDALAEARSYGMWRPLQQHFVREFAARWEAGEIQL